MKENKCLLCGTDILNTDDKICQKCQHELTGNYKVQITFRRKLLEIIVIIAANIGSLILFLCAYLTVSANTGITYKIILITSELVLFFIFAYLIAKSWKSFSRFFN